MLSELSENVHRQWVLDEKANMVKQGILTPEEGKNLGVFYGNVYETCGITGVEPRNESDIGFRRKGAKYPTVVVLSCRDEERERALTEVDLWLQRGNGEVRKIILLTWKEQSEQATKSCTLEVFSDGMIGTECTLEVLPDTGNFDPLQKVTLTLEDMFGSEGLPGKNPGTAYFLSLERLRESAARQEEATKKADEDTTPWPPIPPTPRSPPTEPSAEVANQDISKMNSETSDKLNRDDLGFSVPASGTQLGTPFGAPLSPPLSPSTLGPGFGRKPDLNNQQPKRTKSSARRKAEKRTKCKPCECKKCQQDKLPIFERISSYAAEMIAAAKDPSSKKARTKSSEEVGTNSFFPSEKRSDVPSAASTQHGKEGSSSETGFLQEKIQDRQVIIDLLDNKVNPEGVVADFDAHGFAEESRALMSRHFANHQLIAGVVFGTLGAITWACFGLATGHVVGLWFPTGRTSSVFIGLAMVSSVM